MTNEQKTIFASIIGEPNAGKSTFINQFVGCKIAITTPKVQTTRSILKAIAIHEQTQIILIDTPGLFESKRNKLEANMQQEAWNGIKDADYILLIIDATRGITEYIETLIHKLIKRQIPCSVVLNKTDIMRNKDMLLELAAKLSKFEVFEEIFMTSALDGTGVNAVKNHLCKVARDEPWPYGEDDITDAPKRFLAAESTREALFLSLHDELPYSLSVETEKWEETDKEVKINQVIYVMREGQKKIIIGDNASMIKKIGQTSRKQIAELLGKKVHLFLFDL
jgi:GTP-binding protein Era